MTLVRQLLITMPVLTGHRGRFPIWDFLNIKLHSFNYIDYSGFSIYQFSQPEFFLEKLDIEFEEPSLLDYKSSSRRRKQATVIIPAI
jgi:hypothetical protein